MVRKTALLLSAFAMLSAGNLLAAPLDCSAGVTNVAVTLASGSEGCELGGLIFNDFTLSGTGASVDINMSPETGIFGDYVLLSFEMNPQTATVFLLEYSVTAVQNVYLNGLDAAIFTASGTVTITETACAVAWSPVSGCAQANILGSLVVDNTVAGPYDTYAEFSFPNTGAVYIRKDIQIAGTLSDFKNSHHIQDDRDLPGVPEPATMLLFSTALLGLGFMRRKKS